MGLESAPQRGISIEPRSLIAAADPNVVTPTAVEALTDAFRKGAVTVDDISARADAGKARKMQLAQMQQQQAFDNDPMIQEVKKTVAIASGAKARAETERANREIGLAPLLEIAARAKTIRDVDADKSLGGTEKIAVKFQAAGEEVPKTPEGFIDVAAARQTEEEINQWTRDIEHDASVAKSITYESKTKADGSVEKLPYSTSLGRFLTDEEFRIHTTKEKSPQTFKQWRTARQPKPADSMAFEDSLPKTKKVEGPAQEFSDLIQPRAALPAAGQVAVSPDRLIKEAPAKALTEKTPTENQGRALLALPRFAEANTTLQDLQQKNYDPTSWKSWVSGMMPEILKDGNRKEYETAIAAWSQGLLRLESGAAISIKEQLGYEKAFFPQVGDPPNVVQQKEKLRHAVEETVAQVGSAGNIPPEIKQRADDLFKQALVNAGGKLPVPAGQQAPMKTTTGKTIGISKSGQLYRIP